MGLLEADPGAHSPNPYTEVLVRGVGDHMTRIDEVISEYSTAWRLDRMPTVDRNILRIGAYELLWGADIPDAVAISEAVELASALSTDDSPAFVNGVLGRIQEHKSTLS